MDDFSVGDFAEKMLTQAPEKPAASTARTVPAPVRGAEVPMQDVANIEIPPNFLEAIVENKDYVRPLPPVEEESSTNEDKAEVAEANPVAGQAIDIIIEGLGKMLETVQQTLNEVKEFVNEHSLVTELTSVGMGGVNMAPKKKKSAEEECDYDDEKEKDERVKKILNQFRNKKKKK